MWAVGILTVLTVSRYLFVIPVVVLLKGQITEWKLVTEDIVKKEILINRVTVEEILSILTQERQWHKIK